MEQQQPSYNNNYYPYNQVTHDSQGHVTQDSNTTPFNNPTPSLQDPLSINKIADASSHSAPMGEVMNNTSYQQESAPHPYSVHNAQAHHTPASPQEVFPPNPHAQQQHPHSQSDYEQYVKNHSIYPHSTPSTPQSGYSEGGMETTHNTTTKKETKKQIISNEKFIIAALLTSVVITSIIIGLGWSLFTPKSPTSDVIAHASESANLNATPTDTPATTPNPSQDLVIVYGTTNTPNEESANLSQNQENTSSPVASRTTPTKPVVQKSSPVVAATSPAKTISTTAKTTSVRSTPVAAKTPTRSSIANTVTPKASTSTTSSVPNNATQYWIQIFSTTNKDKALQIQKSFSGQGMTPTIVTKTINNTLYYRLRIGPYFNKAESNKFLSWVKANANYKDAYVSTIKK